MKPLRPFSITHYALLMAFLVVCASAAYGYFTWNQLQQVRQEVEQNSRQAAKKELAEVFTHTLEKARRMIKDFAEWEEVQQQLNLPHYYAYWRNHRMLNAGILPAQVLDAEIYDQQGKALALRPESLLPTRLERPLPPSHVDVSSHEPSLLLFESIPDPGDPDQVIGHVAVRMNFLTQLRENHMYRFVDPASIDITREDARSIEWDELPQALRFTLRENPLGEAVSQVLGSAVFKLSIVLGAITLVLFPALAYMVVRPLRAISTHIDRLRQSPGGLMLNRLAGGLPLAETEKIRNSLNSYQTKLLDVHSSLEQKSRELWELAHHDALTGVRNRRAFDEYWEKMPRRIREQRMSVCLALFDVNHFKAINDSYGHQVGDQVLETIAARISGVLRQGDELYRIGGDEFATLLLDCDGETAMHIAERCQDGIRQVNFQALGIREPVKVSIGLAHTDSPDEQVLNSLHWQADVAMYQAKKPGHSDTVMFTPELARHAEGIYSSWVNNAVFEAVTGGEGLRMYYQPIIDLKTQRVAYYEALVRIERDGEWIMPSNIFPVVEARRLEVDLDNAVIRQVLKDLENNRIPPGTGVSLNLSGPTLVRAQVEEWLLAFRPYLKDYKIVIEVTETALITQIGLATDKLTRLRQHGFGIALDDFGSGYSSIRYLATMPVDTVKFDIALIRCLDDRPQRNIVLHMARMIRELNHRLVAEGIESESLMQQTREMGFNYGQGYFFGRPELPPLAQLHKANIA